MTFKELCEGAISRINPREISGHMSAGNVIAAIETKSGKVYYGVSIDTSCGLGMCAERVAIANMITDGESEIARMVVISETGELMMPCGACREMMMQLSPSSGDIEILTDLENQKMIRLKSLLPIWWGSYKFD
ncbi:MAG: cytidine deaminase [Clostridia bacterium]|jgi:cytidine deaminase|nr:cytidine deaminase [Clostridia bacterium]